MDLVLPVGFEPTTIRLELFCSGPLSYGSKVDAYFGSRKATTLFQRSNSFFLEYCCCLGIHVFRLLFARGLRIPPNSMLRLHMALCHASCSRQASNLRRTPFRGVPLPVGLRELGRLFLTTVDLRGRYQPEHPEREKEMGCRSWGRMRGDGSGRTAEENRKSFKRRSEPGGTVSFGLTNP